MNEAVREELRQAVATEGRPMHMVWLGLELRAKLAQFAVEHGLDNEEQAIAICLLRYFRFEAQDKFSTWLASGEA